MKIGISTGCLYPALTEHSFDQLIEAGFDLFEVFFNTFSELEPDALERMLYICQKHGAAVVSLHPFTSSFESYLLFSGYERRFRDGVNFYEKFFRAAQRIGADKVILHGLTTNYPSTITDSEYCRRFRILQERAACYGVTLLQENVCNFRSRELSFIRTMKEQLPTHAAFVLDIKQALRSELDPLTVAQTMGSRLRHIHVSDTTKEQRCVLPGCGCYDYRPLLQYLQQIHYEGDWMIEVYRSSFDHTQELVQAHQFMNTLLCQFE